MQIRLRKYTIDDLERLVKYADNPKVAHFLMDQFPHPYTLSQGEKFIALTETFDPTRNFAIEVDSEFCGGIGIHPQEDIFRKNAELGYWLAEPYWGKGITTEAVKQIIQYGFETFDITRIFARPYGTNIASQRVLEKAGMTLEGRLDKTIFKNGEYFDELIYGIRK